MFGLGLLYNKHIPHRREQVVLNDSSLSLKTQSLQLLTKIIKAESIYLKCFQSWVRRDQGVKEEGSGSALGVNTLIKAAEQLSEINLNYLHLWS